MDPETEKIIKKQIEKLPVEVRSIIADPKLGDKISNIGKKNGLNTEQIGVLQVETYLVMLGLMHIDEYTNQLKESLKIDYLKLDNILTDMDNSILGEIQDKINETYNKLDEDEIKEIKEGLKNKNQSWNQNVNFVLSGGDYSAFAEEPEQNLNSIQKLDMPIGTTRKIEDMKSNFTI